jgi:uroporphyrinogen III methyltransferase/synthase
MMTGKVYLIGAGPGDPGLFTIKGMQCLQQADVVIYDRLAHPALLKHCKADAELIYVGKESSRHTMKQEDINQLIADKAKEGNIVARLKGGDPFVFGRGGEEAEKLVDEGIEFEVVPGITAAIAVPAYAGIPVTHRKLCSTFGLVTGHEDPTKMESSIKWDKIATGIDTITFYMGVENLPNITRGLIENGRSPETPAAVIRWGTRANQETLVGTLGDIAQKVKEANFGSPAITIVGEVVALREKLRWFDNKPLFGKRIIVTRSREQASALSSKLAGLGADVIEFPVIKIVPPTDTFSIDSAISKLEDFDWVVFTSANGVEWFAKRLLSMRKDIRAMHRAKIAAIGPATAAALEKLMIGVDYIPEKFVAESVVEGFPEDVNGKKILIPRAKEAREVLPEKLKELGAEVHVASVYETITEDSDAQQIKDMLRSGEVDVVTFTSSSTVKNFVSLVGESNEKPLPEGVVAACIGPITAQTAEEMGIKPDIVAEEYTIDGLVQALKEISSN